MLYSGNLIFQENIIILMSVPVSMQTESSVLGCSYQKYGEETIKCPFLFQYLFSCILFQEDPREE